MTSSLPNLSFPSNVESGLLFEEIKGISPKSQKSLNLPRGKG